MRTRALLLACIVMVAAWSARGEEGARELSERREQERVWGISLRPPVGTRVGKRTGDAYLMTIVDEDEKFKIHLSVTRFDAVLSIADVLDKSEAAVKSTHETAKTLSRRELKVGDRPAGVVYYDLPSSKGGARVLMGQAAVQISVEAFAVLRLEALLPDRPMAAGTFEAVLGTLELGGVEELEAQRGAAVKRSKAFTSGLTPQALKEALIELQVFRIIDLPEAGKKGKEKDIGWMRVRQGPGEKLEQAGVFVEVAARVYIDDLVYDSLATYFAADHAGYEDWSIKTTARPVGKRRTKEDLAPTSTETGVRTGGKFDIRIEEPGRGPLVFALEQPPEAYLPQAHAYLLPQLLPADQPATYGFYWYSPTQRKLVYRTDQVVPALDRFNLITRLGPDEAPLRATYAEDRTLIDKSIAPTRKLLPTTPEELKRLWPQG